MPVPGRRYPDDGLCDIAGREPGLLLLVLHGSRGRGDAHERSDWDFAYQAGPGLDADALLSALGEHVGADRVDLADLDRAGALLRFRVARDGVVVFERVPGTYEGFQLSAIDVCCDLAPVLEPAYARTLASLTR